MIPLVLLHIFTANLTSKTRSLDHSNVLLPPFSAFLQRFRSRQAISCFVCPKFNPQMLCAHLFLDRCAVPCWCRSNQHTIVFPDKFYEKSPNLVSVAVFVAKIRFFEISAGTLCPLHPPCKIELNRLCCPSNQKKTSLKKYLKFESLCDMFLIYFKPSLIIKCKLELGILQ